MVYMVHKHSVRYVDYFTMHSDWFLIFPTVSIRCVFSFRGIPFVLFEPLIISGIDDSEFALGKRYEPDFIIFRLFYFWP